MPSCPKGDYLPRRGQMILVSSHFLKLPSFSPSLVPSSNCDCHQRHLFPLYSLHSLKASFHFYCLIQTVLLSKVTNDCLMALFSILVLSDISTAFEMTLPSWGKKYFVLGLISIVFSEITSFIQTSIFGAPTVHARLHLREHKDWKRERYDLTLRSSPSSRERNIPLNNEVMQNKVTVSWRVGWRKCACKPQHLQQRKNTWGCMGPGRHFPEHDKHLSWHLQFH